MDVQGLSKSCAVENRGEGKRVGERREGRGRREGKGRREGREVEEGQRWIGCDEKNDKKERVRFVELGKQNDMIRTMGKKCF